MDWKKIENSLPTLNVPCLFKIYKVEENGYKHEEIVYGWRKASDGNFYIVNYYDNDEFTKQSMIEMCAEWVLLTDKCFK